MWERGGRNRFNLSAGKRGSGMGEETTFSETWKTHKGVCVWGGVACARARSRVIFPDPGASLDQYENSFFTIQEENSSQPNEGQQTARLAL